MSVGPPNPSQVRLIALVTAGNVHGMVELCAKHWKARFVLRLDKPLVYCICIPFKVVYSPVLPSCLKPCTHSLQLYTVRAHKVLHLPIHSHTIVSTAPTVCYTVLIKHAHPRRPSKATKAETNTVDSSVRLKNTPLASGQAFQ